MLTLESIRKIYPVNSIASVTSSKYQGVSVKLLNTVTDFIKDNPGATRKDLIDHVIVEHKNKGTIIRRTIPKLLNAGVLKRVYIGKEQCGGDYRYYLMSQDMPESDKEIIRQNEICAYLEKNGMASVARLSRYLKSCNVTINKILIKLLATDRITKADIGAKSGGRIVYMYDIKRIEK